MYEEIVEKITESLDRNEESAYPKFSSEGYKAHRIDAKNFAEIMPSRGTDKRIAFIDGGNAEIIGSQNFSLNLIRVCCSIFRNNRKLSLKKFEFFSLIRAIDEDGEICYKTDFFIPANYGISLGELSFNSLDPTLTLGVNRAEIGSVANAIRRFAELRLAKLISDEKSAEVIVLDGTLQSTLSNENTYLDELYSSCSANNVVLSALSKTSSLFTDSGNLLSVVLGNISKLPAWFYYPIAEINNVNHKAEMFFAKFHSKSRHIFRLEIFNGQKAQAEETINLLASNCIDPVFIGYPYGLVDADKFARVSKQEKESFKTIFLVKLKNKNIEKYLSSANAHEILDRISF